MFGKLFPAGIFKPAPVVELPKFGDLQYGYYGRIEATEAVPFAKLIAAVPGLGGVNNIIDSEWLKFAYRGKILLIPRACPVRNVSRSTVTSFTNGKQVTHNGKSYHIWMISGGSSAVDDSEYTRFLGPLVGAAGQPRWDTYTFADITQSNLANKSPIGTVTANLSGTLGVIRGRTAAMSWSTHPVGSVAVDLGWRPVLELIP